MWVKSYIAILALCAVVVFLFWKDIRPHIHDNGRFSIYEQTITDWRSPPILINITPDMPDSQKREIAILNQKTNVLTGRGLGSFPYLFSTKHKTAFDDPHCVYLRVLYEVGLFGLVLFLGMITWVVIKRFNDAREDKFILACYCSMFFILLAGIGIPVLLIEPLRFFCIVIFIFLSRR